MHIKICFSIKPLTLIMFFHSCCLFISSASTDKLMTFRVFPCPHSQYANLIRDRQTGRQRQQLREDVPIKACLVFIKLPGADRWMMAGREVIMMQPRSWFQRKVNVSFSSSLYFYNTNFILSSSSISQLSK